MHRLVCVKTKIKYSYLNYRRMFCRRVSPTSCISSVASFLFSIKYFFRVFRFLSLVHFARVLLSVVVIRVNFVEPWGTGPMHSGMGSN